MKKTDQAVKNEAVKEAIQDIQSNILATKPIYLSRTKPVKAINLYFPPGVGKFFIERVDKNHVRFLINKDEIDRLIDKAEQIAKDMPQELKDEILKKE